MAANGTGAHAGVRHTQRWELWFRAALQPLLFCMGIDFSFLLSSSLKAEKPEQVFLTAGQRTTKAAGRDRSGQKGHPQVKSKGKTPSPAAEQGWHSSQLREIGARKWFVCVL